MSEHTPGPWFAHQPAGKQHQWGVVADADYKPSSGARRRIAWIGNPSPLTNNLDDEVRANAALIAAAPELYEALREMVDEARAASLALGELGFSSDALTAAATRAVAALAKASGDGR